LTIPKFAVPTGTSLEVVVVAILETGTLTTLPYCWLSELARFKLALAALEIGAWPGVNQEAGRLE